MKFYSYDSKTGVTTEIAAPAHSMDASGYLHFTTTIGNNILITDKPLAKK